MSSLSKEQIIQEINVLERLDSYFKNYPIHFALSIIKKDLEKSKKELKKIRKRESNQRYNQ